MRSAFIGDSSASTSRPVRHAEGSERSSGSRATPTDRPRSRVVNACGEYERVTRRPSPGRQAPTEAPGEPHLWGAMADDPQQIVFDWRAPLLPPGREERRDHPCEERGNRTNARVNPKG